MICFYIKDKLLIKVYDQGEDLQVLTNNEKERERWFSVWRKDYKASVYRAIDSVLKDITGDHLDINQINWIQI